MQSDSDNSTGDDDELSPLEKQQRGRARPKKKAKAQPQQKPDDSSTAITTPGPLSNVPAAISQLVMEAQAGLDALRGAKAMPDINEDQLGSLHNRLTAKKNGLGKKPANNVNSLEAINPLRCKIGLITEVLKAISTFEKKRSRVHAKWRIDQQCHVHLSLLVLVRARVRACVRACVRVCVSVCVCVCVI